MTVTVYKSTDASAPTLSGTFGDLTTLLDAILVNGYGSKAAQGWTIAFTATNKRAYLQPAGSNGRYLFVDDSAAGTANYARVTGYETMSSISAGVNQFPNANQFAGGLYAHKSSVVSATVRPWYAYGNGKILYLFVNTDAANTMGCLIFGDFTSYVPADQYNTLIIAGTTTTAGQGANNNQLQITNAYNTIALVGHYTCRSYTGVGTSVALSKFSNLGMLGVSSNGGTPFGLGTHVDNGGTNRATTLLPFPSLSDGSYMMERIWLTESSAPQCLRGELPGMWAPLQDVSLAPFQLLDTFSGSNALTGKTFEVMKAVFSSTGAYWYMETTAGGW